MDKQDNFYRLALANKISELERIHLTVGELLNKWEIPAAMGFTLDLVLEEAFTNVVKYAFDDDQTHEILLEFEKNDQWLEIRLIDDGLSYDPTQKTDPDIEAPVEDRQVGGLGIFLIKQFMDSVDYQRKDNKNYLILTKQISR